MKEKLNKGKETLGSLLGMGKEHGGVGYLKLENENTRYVRRVGLHL